MESETRPTRSAPSAGKIIFWIFLAALALLLVWQFFQIQDDCARHRFMDDWQSHLC